MTFLPLKMIASSPPKKPLIEEVHVERVVCDNCHATTVFAQEVITKTIHLPNGMGDVANLGFQFVKNVEDQLHAQDREIKVLRAMVMHLIERPSDIEELNGILKEAERPVVLLNNEVKPETNVGPPGGMLID